MYGYYKSPLNPLRISKEGIHLQIEKDGNTLRYERTSPNESIEEILLTKDCGIIINPIEAQKIHKQVSQYLLIEFEKSVFVEPKDTNNIYLTFPIDIGVFISGRKNYDLLDTFTLAKQKYTLYGDPRNGVICKYHKSPVFTSLPNNLNPLINGVMKLKLINTTDDWIEITKSVFDSHEMKVYFNVALVSMRAHMKILSEKIAETEFINSGVKRGMKKALEVFEPSKITVSQKKFTMEEGL